MGLPAFYKSCQGVTKPRYAGLLAVSTTSQAFPPPSNPLVTTSEKSNTTQKGPSALWSSIKESIAQKSWDTLLTQPKVGFQVGSAMCPGRHSRQASSEGQVTVRLGQGLDGCCNDYSHSV